MYYFLLFQTYENAQGSITPNRGGGEAHSQAQEAGSLPELILYGCKVLWMHANYNSFFPRPNHCDVPVMLTKVVRT